MFNSFLWDFYRSSDLQKRRFKSLKVDINPFKNAIIDFEVSQKSNICRLPPILSFLFTLLTPNGKTIETLKIKFESYIAKLAQIE